MLGVLNLLPADDMQSTATTSGPHSSLQVREFGNRETVAINMTTFPPAEFLNPAWLVRARPD